MSYDTQDGGVLCMTLAVCMPADSQVPVLVKEEGVMPPGSAICDAITQA
jgi:hypothetical protein